MNLYDPYTEEYCAEKLMEEIRAYDSAMVEYEDLKANIEKYAANDGSSETHRELVIKLAAVMTSTRRAQHRVEYWVEQLNNLCTTN